MTKKAQLATITVASVVGLVLLVATARKKPTPSGQTPVYLMQVTDTTKVYVSTPGPDGLVHAHQGFYLQTGVKRIGSKDWASVPTSVVCDSLYHPWKGTFILVNAVDSNRTP